MDKKKLAAAMAAVMAHIRTTEQAAAAVAEELPAEHPQVQQVMMSQPNLWGISGRQVQMQANSMMQMRMFK